MSQQIRIWKKPKAEQRFNRDLAKRNESRNIKLSEMAKAVEGALKRSSDYGVIYADTYELLLVKVALEVQHGPGAKSASQHMQEYDDFYAGREDRRTGRSKLTQGDNQALMRDAIELAIARGEVRKYIDPDGSRVAIHLLNCQASTWTPVRWTAFLAQAGKVDNYIPSPQALEAYNQPEEHSAHDHELRHLPTGRVHVQLRSWGQIAS